MPILKRTQKILHNEHVEVETGHYINVKKWLSRVYKVQAVNSLKDEKTGLDKEWILDGDCKIIFAYLFNFGKVHGFDNIYPNYTLVCDELGMNDRKLSRKIALLSEIGLLTVIKNKSNNGRFDSNRYNVNTPRTISNRKWFNVQGEQLIGKLYKFDYTLFIKGSF